MGHRLPILLLALVLLAAPAQAHAVYASSEPAQGAQLNASPTVIRVTMTEPLDTAGSGLEVYDQQGNRVDNDDFAVEDGDKPILTVSVPDLPDGAYLVKWRAFSGADGHTTRGSFGFAVGDYAPPATTSQQATENEKAMAFRATAYFGFALAFGSILFLLTVPLPADQPTKPRLLRLTSLGGAIYALGSLGLFWDTLQSTGLGLAALLQSTLGTSLAVRIAMGLAVAAIAWGTRHRASWRPPLAACLVALVVAAVASARFAHSSIHGLGAILLDATHFLAAGGWIGGLVVFLYLLLRLKPTDRSARRLGDGFGKMAMASVILLGLTGVLSTVLVIGPEVTDPRILLHTTYGRILAAKIIMAAGMVTLAAMNRYWFLPKLLGDERTGQRDLRVAVSAETGLGLIAIALAGILTTLSPAIIAAPVLAEQPALTLTGQGETYAVQLHWQEQPRAATVIHGDMTITNLADGKPLSDPNCGRADCILVTFQATDSEEPGPTYEAKSDGLGNWSVHGVFLVEAGGYTAIIRIQTADVFLEEIRIEWTLPP